MGNVYMIALYFVFFFLWVKGFHLEIIFILSFQWLHIITMHSFVLSPFSPSLPFHLNFCCGVSNRTDLVS